MNDFITYLYNTEHRRSNHTNNSGTEEFRYDIQYREAPSSVGEFVSLGVCKFVSLGCNSPFSFSECVKLPSYPF